MNYDNKDNPAGQRTCPVRTRRWAGAVLSLVLAGGLPGCQADQAGSPRLPRRCRPLTWTI